jgi:hypothetical protein
MIKMGTEELESDDTKTVATWIEDFIVANGTGNDRKWIQGNARDLNQAVTKMLTGKGKSSGALKYDHLPLLHASAGVAKRSGNISLFFAINTSEEIILIGVGEHTASSSYRLRWKVPTWAHQGKSISL